MGYAMRFPNVAALPLIMILAFPALATVYPKEVVPVDTQNDGNTICTSIVGLDDES